MFTFILEDMTTDISTIRSRIEQYAGREFLTETGKPFSYGVTTNMVVLHHTTRSIPKGDSVKALQRPSYLYAILTDQRVTADDGSAPTTG